MEMISEHNAEFEAGEHTFNIGENELADLTPDEIKEILLQVGIYCGVPAMVDSFRIARTVLGEMNEI